MWIYDYKAEEDNPYRTAPFVQIMHMSYIDNLPLWSYPWHAHPHSFEIAVILQGTGQLMLEDESYPVKAGSICCIVPKTSHRFITTESEGMQYFTLRFRAEAETEGLQRFFSELGCAQTSAENHLEYFRATIRTLFSIHHANGGKADETFQSICLSLLLMVKTLFTNKTLRLRIGQRYSLSDILHYIEENRQEKITLESLSRRFNISASHLSRIFTAAYHTSPINYLIQARITYATEYLLKTDLPVAKISELVGYDNPTHFSNMFQKRIGCTPGEYRERNREVPTEKKKV